MLPTQEDLDDYLHAITEYVYTIPYHLQALYDRLASDIQRHSPYTVPGLSFEIPAPAPPMEPPSLPLPWYQLGFIENDATRRRIAIAAVAGAGLGVGLGSWAYLHTNDGKRKRKDSFDKFKMRKEVVGEYGSGRH
jgi:hypothetical protein